jgi:hypothetical protein
MGKQNSGVRIQNIRVPENGRGDVVLIERPKFKHLLLFENSPNDQSIKLSA